MGGITKTIPHFRLSPSRAAWPFSFKRLNSITRRWSGVAGAVLTAIVGAIKNKTA